MNHRRRIESDVFTSLDVNTLLPFIHICEPNIAALENDSLSLNYFFRLN